MVVLARSMMLMLASAGLRAAKGLGDENAISFEERVGNVYDMKPKLKIKGSGFSGFSTNDIKSFRFEPPLEIALEDGGVASEDAKKEFRATVKSDDTILIERLSSRSWPASESDNLLKLVEAYLDGKSLLADPITVATVIPTPTVFPSNNLLYLTKSPRVMINGTNFDQKRTALFFSPPLLDGVDVNTMVKSPTTIWVSLVQKNAGTRWAEEPGPLKLVAIDTGAGRMLLREDLGGVTIAEMQADMKGHSISVEGHEEVKLYQSTKVLTIAGTGFNPDSTKLRFAQTVLTEGKNYTADVASTSVTISLTEGSKWRLNDAVLPGPLVLLAVDAGDGYVPLGATTAKAGRKIATVFEDPRVEAADTIIGRTLTHELYVKGSGFTKMYPPSIVFEPHLDKDNFMVEVLNRTSIKVSLAGEGRGWLPEGEAGNISIASINTGAGMVQFTEPVPVAKVVADDEPHHSGIVIKPNYVAQLYQSSDNPLYVEGEGFPVGAEVKLVFGPGGPEDECFSCRVLSETQLEVQLHDGCQWAQHGGPLLLVEASFGDDKVEFPSVGLKLAVILDDPMVSASTLQVYASHTKRMTIKGRGFESAFNTHIQPKVVLSPTAAGDYFIKDEDWTDGTITLSLSTEDGAKWADVRSPEETVNIRVVSVDTGAGSVPMPGRGIVVAEVRMDDSTFSCDDSCIYSNDGDCDENQDGLGGASWSQFMARDDGTITGQTFTSSRGKYLDIPSIMEASDDLPAEVPSCPMGTDCTDCGLQLVEEGACSNTCEYARDGVCDDRRNLGVCATGTDCQDCGPWGQSNFTEVPSSSTITESYENDDSDFLASSNHPLLVGQGINAVGRYKRVFVKHTVIRKESEKAESLFLETLWAAIVIVGASVTAYVGLLVVRFARGEKIHLPVPTDPDLELSSRR